MRRCRWSVTGFISSALRWGSGFLIAWAGILSVQAQQVSSARPANSFVSGRRVIAYFDFDEKALGNYESLPMYWRRHEAKGFPFYLEGRFDEQVGHGSEPSFRLDLDGGSLAYHYEGHKVGRGIPIRSASDYMVSTWIRVKGLEQARAYITAYYINRKGERIAETERRSRLIGGGDGLREFQPVAVPLPGEVKNARYIGITLWLTQAEVWERDSAALRGVEHEDVQATAWFDDIAVYRLPRVSLTADAPGNVFNARADVVLRTEVSDPSSPYIEFSSADLSANLTVKKADGSVVKKRAIQIHSEEEIGSANTVFEDLGAGLYSAELLVSSGKIPLVRHRIRFVCIEPHISPPVDTGRGWGVILKELDEELLSGQRALLRDLSPEMVKVPVWCAEKASQGERPAEWAIDAYMEAVVDAYAEPVAMLVDELNPDQQVERDQRETQPMLELFSEDPLAWKPMISGTWSRYAGLAHVWQLGRDGYANMSADYRVNEIIPLLRREMQPLMSEPLLAYSSMAGFISKEDRPADFYSVTVPWETPPEHIKLYLEPFSNTRMEKTWITIEPLPRNGYPRMLRMADLAKRLVEAYFLKPGAVFMEAAWEGRLDLLKAQVHPREDFIVFRTIADVLGGAVPVAQTSINGRARCLLFDRNGLAIQFAWDDYAPPGGETYHLLLGEKAEQVDLWGQRKSLPTVNGRQQITLGRTPSFIIRSSTWLMDFRRQFHVEPSLLEASFDKRSYEVVFRNTYHEPISGLLRLIPPKGWEVRPFRMSFSLEPGEEFRRELDVLFPLNAESGLKAFVGDITVDADRRYRMRIPAWFELGLEDIDLDAFVFQTGDDVVVRMSLANHTAKKISFDGFVVAPERQRISRPFINFLPGQSATKDFILEDATDLAGRNIRVGFKEIEGRNRLWNKLIKVPY
jgi:hypothetical protein